MKKLVVLFFLCYFNMYGQNNIEEVRIVKDDKQIDPSNPSNRVARKIYGLQRNFTPTDDKLDKYLRDSVIVTVNTRNIGQAFQ